MLLKYFRVLYLLFFLISGGGGPGKGSNALNNPIIFFKILYKLNCCKVSVILSTILLSQSTYHKYRQLETTSKLQSMFTFLKILTVK